MRSQIADGAVGAIAGFIIASVSGENRGIAALQL